MKDNHSQESPSVEKLFETTDYEPTNGVFDRGTRIPTTADNVSAHPDSFRSLNLCCGNSFNCTDRIDIMKTEATTMVHDIEKGLPYPDQTFKEVYFRCGLEHIKNIGQLADEIHRVLLPGGRLYLRTDYAGYLPLYLFNSHEHNKALEVQYHDGKGYGHDKATEEIEDHHYHLFVQSHLDHLFKKMRIRVYTYVYGGRNKFFTMLLKLLPKHLGAVHIEMEAIK